MKNILTIICEMFLAIVAYVVLGVATWFGMVAAEKIWERILRIG